MDQSALQRQTPSQYSGGGSVHGDQVEELRIEDLPLDKKLEILKKYNPYEFYDDGRYIDAQDTVNAWCLGQIVQVDNKNLNIHFDGWSSRWDIWQKVTSFKIAPFRKNSRGYTGQNKIALRQMKFSLDELHTQKQRVEKLIESDLNGLGAFETTQFLRGRLYIYVDFLLQGGQYQEEHIDAINDFLYCVLRLIVTWLKKLPKLLHLYAQIKVNPDLFLIDENIAIVLCAYEFMDILKKFFCSCLRCIKYYMLNDKNPIRFDHGVTQVFDQVNFEANRKKDEEDIDVDEVKDDIILRRNLVYGQFMNFINYFADIGGFDAIVDYLKLGNELQEDKIPLEMISLLTHPFRNCIQIFAPTFAQQFVSSVRDILVNRLKSMTEKELKEIDKESVGRVLNDLRDFFTLAMNENETAELIETNQLQVALKFLKSTYLEKRLKGISDIKLIIERVEWSIKQAQIKSQFTKNGGAMETQDIMGVKPLKSPKWITPEIMRNWILSQRVLDIVLGENTHLEIVKRSSCILKFLAKQNSLPPDSIDLIWKCQLGKHEEMVRVVYGTIQELVPFISIEQIDLFYQKIQQVPALQYDDKFLEFLKDFTLKSLENYYELRSSEGSMSENSAHPYDQLIRKREFHVISKFAEYLNNPQPLQSEDKQYGLPIFWELIQDRAPQVSNEIMQISINSLSEILKQNFSQPIKINYLLKAVENLMKGESINQSIVVAQNIISDYPSYEFSENNISQQSIISQLEKQLNFVNQIIQNIVAYSNNVKEKVRQMAEKKRTLPDDVANFVFVGKHPHEQTLNHLLEFLEFLIVNTNQEVTLGTQNIDNLWQIFVQSPNFTSDQNLFLKWINMHRENNYDKKEYFLFTEEEKKYFFTRILCNPTYVDFQKISIGQVKCFHKYFKDINKQEDNLEIIRRKLKVKNYNALAGLDSLWRMAIESLNERSRDESMDLLVDLHLKFDHQAINPQDQIQIWTSFIDTCMRNLGSDNDNLVTNTIQVLSKFLDKYEGKKTLKPEFKQSQFTNLNPLNITILNRNDNQRRQVHVSYFQTIGFLRQKIAEAFDMQINEFSMTIKNVFVDPDEDDDRYIKDIGLIQSAIIMKNPNYNPDGHPKFLISNNQANYDKFFFLLSKNKPNLIEKTWDLLSKLPINIKLQQEIKELSGVMENKANWEKILDPKSTYKLLYSLKIINALHGNRKDTKATQWKFKFVQMGGFNHLLRTFISLDVISIETNLTMKCIEHLIIILYDFITSDKELSKQVIDQKEQVIQKCINLIDLISDYSLTVEKKRGESQEDISKRIQQNRQKKNKFKSYMAKGSQGAEQQKQNEDEEDQDSQEFTQMQQIMKQFQEDQQIVSNLFKFMQFTIFSHDSSAVVSIAKYPNLQNLLLKSTIMSENVCIRTEILKRMREILTPKTLSPEIKQMQIIIKNIIFDIQPFAEKYEQRCVTFYEGVMQLIDQLNVQDIIELKAEFEVQIMDLAKFILLREIKEKNTQDSDYLLIGKMKLLRSLLFKFPHLKVPVGAILTEHLIHNCLFEVPQGGTTKNQSKVGGPPKCKNQISRQIACRLLATLCRDCLPNLNNVLQYLQKFNQNPSWRTNKDHDWNISLMESEKSSTGYVGLKNLGCICYMNSLFQQIFMINSLRNDILSVRDNSNDSKEENMLYQLQLLFAGLLKSEKQYVSPKGFCHAFKDWEGQPTNVLEQMDVEEFFNMLMDRIETAIKGSPVQNTIQYHFGGKFASEMICKGCPHYYERSEPYLSISVPVKNKKSILEGLNAFIQGEMLEGDNAYLCEKCDKKVDTLKRTCIKRLPRYLIIALRRFEFDYDRMIRVKVNDYCEFPMELNMEPYTQEGLRRREKLQKMKEERGEDAVQEEIEIEGLKYPKEYYEYQLTGTVIHSGTADSGHYYSFIKDREHPESGKWYEMNDHIVRDFDPNDIPQDCFGGEDTFQGYNMVQMKSMKWRNSYLLFYERKVPIEVPSDDEKELDKTSSKDKEDVEMQQVKTGLSGDISIMSEIEEKIAYENQKYWQNRFLFGNEYHDFVYDISLNWNTSYLIPKNHLTKNNDFHLVGLPMPKDYDRDVIIQEPLDVKIPLNDEQLSQFEERVFKFAAGFYITILQRATNKVFIPQMLNLLKGYINKNFNCAHWLISEFCNFKILDENILQCASKEMRKFTAGLLYCAMLKVYQVERTKLNDYWSDPTDPAKNSTVLGNFALILLNNIFYVKRFIGHMSQYMQLLARFSSLGGEAREFLLRGRAVGRLMEFFFDDVSPHKDFFRDMSEINPIYKEKPEIGLPTEIDRKQINHFQEILERRRMKNLADAIPKYKYLLEAVSNCIRAFKNGEVRSYHSTDDVAFESLLQQERDLYVPDSKFLKKVFAEARKNRSAVAVCVGYCHFAWSERETFQELLGVIHHGLNEYDYDELKPYLLLIQFLLQKPGFENPEQRFELVLQALLDVTKHNQQYYKFMEVIIDFILKITSKIPQVKQWFVTKRQQWQWIVQWSESTRFPVNQMDMSSQLRLLKRRGQMQLHQQYLKSEAYKNQTVREVRNRRLDLLLKGEVPDLSAEPDMDTIDMQDYKFTVGEQVELYNRKQEKLTYMHVEQVLDEMIYCKMLGPIENIQNGNQFAWIACDSDKLMPFGTFKQQYRNKMIELLQQQMERMRTQSAHGATNTQMRQGGGNDPDYEMGDNTGNNYNQDIDESDEDNDSGQDNLYT